MIYEKTFETLRNRAQIIAIAGPKESGKSYASVILQSEAHFVRVSFADALKRMLMSIGLTHAQCDGAEKEAPSDLLCGKTPRHAMQTLGTEWGREQIANDIWVRATIFEIYQATVSHPPGQFSRFVIDDLRFDNEASALHRAGAKIWEVRRPGYGYDTRHASEAGLTSSFVDRTIPNDFGVEHLKTQVRAAWAEQSHAWSNGLDFAVDC